MKLIFGDKHAKDMKKIQPIIDKINEYFVSYQSLSEDELKHKTVEFRERLSKEEEPESLDDILPEAYAVVKEACRRHVGKSWYAGGSMIPWNDVHHDVQIAGAIVLHQGKISEMATGEGKTLASTMPVYLNALTGKGVHVITVNDYLAQRDSEWMGQIYNYLGLMVGCILNDMPPDIRRKQYACDITYGTNNEFGFDYLRDNMTVSKEHLVQRNYYYAIIDEVDSVLIDEARTPLIISGPVERSTQRYDKMLPHVKKLVNNQTLLVNRLLTEAEKLLEQDENSLDAGKNILLCRKGSPKSSRLRKLLNEPKNQKIVSKVEAQYLIEKRVHELESELFYVIDEKGHNIDLTEKGSNCISPEDPNMFVLKDLVEEIQQIEARTDLSDKDKEELKEKSRIENDIKGEELHNISQLLRAYALFEKDVDYIVDENKVLIVDEFTGRLMPGRRFSDGLHQALEAKESVKIERETQTFATITIQNYFRMYEKLAGMTGTAETEASEFVHTYKMDVVVVPTDKPIRRIDYDDVIYRTKREKYNAIIEEIERLHKNRLPVLVGTVSVEVSELLSRMLRRFNISHSVLNAKQHQHEAEIVRNAGQAGAVTIATNMAGRGTDIKLAPEVLKCKKCCVKCKDNCETSEECKGVKKREDYKNCREDMQCGLQIIGTERHESRRIDRQLRGRSGRQGDPGSSRFFISLEDDLMRLFGSDRISSIMGRLGMKEGEPIEHPMITKSIGNAQRKIEMINFERRKHTLEYDDVMNKQREVIYSLRRDILTEEDLSEVIFDIFYDAVEEVFDEYCPSNLKSNEWKLDEYIKWLKRNVLFLNLPEFPVDMRDEEILDKVKECITDAYKKKEEFYGKPLLNHIARYVGLEVIDDAWKEHLLTLDELSDSVGLRAYGQQDPLEEYKSESFALFEEMLTTIHKNIFEKVFRAQVVREETQRGTSNSRLTLSMPDLSVSNFSSLAAQAGQDNAPQREGGRPSSAVKTVVREAPKVGRNDSCPCGSGKKYKKCCGIGGE